MAVLWLGSLRAAARWTENARLHFGIPLVVRPACYPQGARVKFSSNDSSRSPHLLEVDLGLLPDDGLRDHLGGGIGQADFKTNSWLVAGDT